MKRVIFFCGLLVVLMLGLIFLYEAQAGEPKMLIPETTFDFGLIPEGNVVSHHYLIKNLGTDTLKIENVRPG
jgi:hypothetical protein